MLTFEATGSRDSECADDTQQCAHTMNTVRSYFATSVAFLVVAIGWWAADAVICCNSSSVASGGGDAVASCQNKNRTFHTVEAFGDTCDDNRTAVSIQKCCPLGQFYDSNLNLCQLAGMDSVYHLQMIVFEMMTIFKDMDEGVMVGYNYNEQPLCDAGDVLVDVTIRNAWKLKALFSSVIDIPPGYCFDYIPNLYLVMRMCHAAAVCCNSSSVTSGGGDVVASCQNKNRTFHMVQAFGGATCDDNSTAVSIRKCCPLGQLYDPDLNLCRLAGMDGVEHLQQKIMSVFRATGEKVMVGYNYNEQPLCDAGDVLVDVTIGDVWWLTTSVFSVFNIPPGYCFDLTPSNILVARMCHAAAKVCCNSSSVASGGGDVVASCQNKNRTFHTVQALKRGTCDDNQTAVSFYKCCPLGQTFSYFSQTCLPGGRDGDEHLQRMIQLLNVEEAVFDVVMVGYNYEQIPCEFPFNLRFEPAMNLLMEREPQEFPDMFCLDLSPYGELVGGTCYTNWCFDETCVRRCCKGDRMLVDGPNGPECTLSEKPFTMSAYKIDEDSRQLSQSNRTVLPYYVGFNCLHKDMLNDGFQLTHDGKLYLTYEHHIVPPTEYCVGYSQVTDSIVAFICDADFVYMVERARASSIPIFFQASSVVSAVCLALTLLVYNTLPSLRNNRNYYVKCYMSHQFMSYICVIAQMIMKNKQGYTCVLFGYITLFVFLSTLCWLNVICFDIYWMIRYNISINRNTSTSVRTIMYYFYCWGLSSIFVYTGLFFQYSQDESLQQLEPDFGKYGCFYYHVSGYEGLIFILIPMFVMLTANLILFRLTTKHSSRIKSELNKFNRTDSKIENFLLQKKKFVMSIKLFLVMGIPYFLTVLSIILRIEGAIWYIIYAASSLQGVFICIIFVAKRNVIMDLRKMFRGSMDHSEPIQIDNISDSS